MKKSYVKCARCGLPKAEHEDDCPGDLFCEMHVDVDRAEDRIVCAALNLFGAIRHWNWRGALREWRELRASCAGFVDATIDVARKQDAARGRTGGSA